MLNSCPVCRFLPCLLHRPTFWSFICLSLRLNLNDTLCQTIFSFLCHLRGSSAYSIAVNPFYDLYHVTMLLLCFYLLSFHLFSPLKSFCYTHIHNTSVLYDLFLYSYNLMSFSPHPLLSPSLLFFQVGGAAVLGVGIWTLVEKSDYLSLLASSTFAVSAYILILAGGLVVVTGFLGCCAVIREQRSCLSTVRRWTHLLRSLPFIYPVIKVWVYGIICMWCRNVNFSQCLLKSQFIFWSPYKKQNKTYLLGVSGYQFKIQSHSKPCSFLWEDLR